eukprot:scaffold261_cov169-Ochromonas_danica.AAC.3
MGVLFYLRGVHGHADGPRQFLWSQFAKLQGTYRLLHFVNSYLATAIGRDSLPQQQVLAGKACNKWPTIKLMWYKLFVLTLPLVKIIGIIAELLFTTLSIQLKFSLVSKD